MNTASRLARATVARQGHTCVQSLGQGQCQPSRSEPCPHLLVPAVEVPTPLARTALGSPHPMRCLTFHILGCPLLKVLQPAAAVSAQANAHDVLPGVPQQRQLAHGVDVQLHAQAHQAANNRCGAHDTGCSGPARPGSRRESRYVTREPRAWLAPSLPQQPTHWGLHACFAVNNQAVVPGGSG